MITLALCLFFGFLGIAIILLLLLNKLADKCLKGDFIKLHSDDEDENIDDFHGNAVAEEEGEEARIAFDDIDECVCDVKTDPEREKSNNTDNLPTNESINDNLPTNDGINYNLMTNDGINYNLPTYDNTTDNLLTNDGINYNLPTYDNTTDNLLTNDGINGNLPTYDDTTDQSLLITVTHEQPYTYVSPAKLKFTLEYRKKTKTVIGCIRKVEGLERLIECVRSIQGLPRSEGREYDLVCFHVKVTPHCIYKVKTKWSKVEDSHMLYLGFKLGPLKEDNLANSRICIRLYGVKRSMLTQAKCLGECFVSFTDIMESGGGTLQMVEEIVPLSLSTVDKVSPLSASSIP